MATLRGQIKEANAKHGPVTPPQSERYFHNKQIHRRHTGLVQQTVQIVARFAITI